VDDGEVGEDDVDPPHVALTSVATQMTTGNAAALVDFTDIRPSLNKVPSHEQITPATPPYAKHAP
jgi:hypothetical protein